jgi:hypothetical protein
VTDRDTAAFHLPPAAARPPESFPAAVSFLGLYQGILPCLAYKPSFSSVFVSGGVAEPVFEGGS